MINVKAASIRYGVSRFWQSKLQSNSYYTQSLSIYLNKIFSETFISREFIRAGITYDFSIFHFSANFISVDIFLQDSINEEIKYITRSKSSKFTQLFFHFPRIASKKKKLKFFLSKSSVLKNTNSRKPFIYRGRLVKKKVLNSPNPKIIKFFRRYRKIYRFFSIFRNFRSFFRFLLKHSKKHHQLFKFHLRLKKISRFFSFFFFKFFNRKFFYYPSFFKFFKSFFSSYSKNFTSFLPRKFFPSVAAFKFRIIKFRSFSKLLNFSKKNYFLFSNIQKSSKIFNPNIFRLSSKFKRLKYSKRFKRSKTFFFSPSFSHSSLIFRFYSKILKTFLIPFFPIKDIRFYRSKYTSINVNAFVFYSSVKLYYKYMLNDVIKPIIRGASIYYSGFFVLCKGRFTRAQMASKRLFRRNFVNYNRTYRPIYYAINSVALRYGASTVHIWLQH